MGVLHVVVKKVWGSRIVTLDTRRVYSGREG